MDFRRAPATTRLISPCAIRFLQTTISSTFDDGHSLEETIQQISFRSGRDGFDVILQPPFSMLKVARGGDVAGRALWFGLGSRRLYCLQRAAAQLWPLRVAVEVEVLREPAGGLAVAVVGGEGGAADLWDWRQHVSGILGHPDSIAAAHETIQADEAKALQDDFVGRVVRSSGSTSGRNKQQRQSFESQASVATSTGSASPELGPPAPSATSSTASPPPEPEPPFLRPPVEELPKPEDLFEGIWYGTDGEAYVTNVEDPLHWKVTRTDATSVRHFDLTCDRAKDIVWWGFAGKQFAKLSEARHLKGVCLNWYMNSQQKPRWTWYRSRNAVAEDKRHSGNGLLCI